MKINGSFQTPFQTMSTDIFRREAQMFIQVVKDTNMELEPITPTILHSEINRSDYKYYADLLKESSPKFVMDTKEYTIGQILTTYNTSLGIIAMEIATTDKVKTVHDLVYEIKSVRQYSENTDKLQQYISIALFGLLTFARFGYVHGDHHMNNMAICDYDYYFESKHIVYKEWMNKKKLFIFDFAKTHKMEDTELSKFIGLYNSFINEQTPSTHSLTRCLEFIYKQGYYSLSHEAIRYFTDDHRQYKWITESLDFITLDVAIYVRELHQARENAITSTIARVNRLIGNVEQIISSPDRDRKEKVKKKVLESSESWSGKDWSEQFIQNLLEKQRIAQTISNKISNKKITLVTSEELIQLRIKEEQQKQQPELKRGREERREEHIENQRQTKDQQEELEQKKKQKIDKDKDERINIAIVSCFIGLLCVVSYIFENTGMRGGGKRSRDDSVAISETSYTYHDTSMLHDTKPLQVITNITNKKPKYEVAHTTIEIDYSDTDIQNIIILLISAIECMNNGIESVESLMIIGKKRSSPLKDEGDEQVKKSKKKTKIRIIEV